MPTSPARVLRPSDPDGPDVAAVRWDGEPPQLNLTRTREANGELDFALDSYKDILGQVAAEKRDLRADLQFLIARTLARQAIADPSKTAAAERALKEARTAAARAEAALKKVAARVKKAASASDVPETRPEPILCE